MYLFQIITPQGKSYENQIEHAQVPGETGYIGVLSNHAPLILSSAGGLLTVREKGGKNRVFKVGPGFFEVRKNEAVFMAETQSEAAS